MPRIKPPQTGQNIHTVSFSNDLWLGLSRIGSPKEVLEGIVYNFLMRELSKQDSYVISTRRQIKNLVVAPAKKIERALKKGLFEDLRLIGLNPFETIKQWIDEVDVTSILELPKEDYETE